MPVALARPSEPRVYTRGFSARLRWRIVARASRPCVPQQSTGGTPVPHACARIAITALVAIALFAPHVAFAADEPKVDPEARQAIDGSLKWLASMQQPAGNWGEHQFRVAFTAYTVMAFLAAGQLPDEGPYGAAVGRGVRYLADSVRADGYIVDREDPNDGKGMYGHGIATIALAEACGQAGGPAGATDGAGGEVRAKLKRAVQLIVSTQNPQGGWRYQPRVADADLSVTVLQVVALRAAKNDGLDVPRQTIDRAVAYVRSCRSREAVGGGGGFAYQPGGPPGFARTAAALYSLQVCGLYDDPMCKAASTYLVQQRGRKYQWFTYGNFYAGPAQYMVGGPTWADWYADVRQTLLGRVRREGDLCHWPVLDGDASGFSAVYVTAVNTLILSLPDGYVPLYQR
jgi:hypothetical protein